MYGIYEVSLENGNWKYEQLSFFNFNNKWHEMRTKNIPVDAEMQKTFYLKEAIKVLDEQEHSLRHALIIVDENEMPSND